MRVIVCTMWSKSHQELADISLPNLREYCTKRGYELQYINPPDNNCWFKKHEHFGYSFSALNNGDIIWYCDIDTLVTNHKVKIEDFITPIHSFFITKDFTELNGGSVIIKNGNSARKFNDFILRHRCKYQNEQNVYNDSYPVLQDIIKILPHPSINSYNYSLYPECKEYVGREDLGDWHPGNFVIHFPALSIENRIAMMQEYKDKIIYE